MRILTAIFNFIAAPIQAWADACAAEFGGEYDEARQTVVTLGDDGNLA